MAAETLVGTVRLEKTIGSKGKQPYKHTASETQTNSQSFQKKSGWNRLEIAIYDRIWLEMSRHQWKCISMNLHILKWLEMVLNCQKKAGNSGKQKCCLLLWLQTTKTKQSDLTIIGSFYTIVQYGN